MKKFLITVFSLVIIILIVFYAVFSIGFYVDLYPGAPISVPFRSDEQRLTRQMPNGLYESFILHGVDINSVVAGKHSSQFPADEKDYLRWFGYISEMGANALRVNTVMNTGFYNALYKYNSTCERPLYLLQGVSVTDYANNNANDAYGSGFYEKLISDLTDLVDIIQQREELAPILDVMDYEGAYEGYLDLLARYHSIPVIAAGYGFSSSRGLTRMNTSTWEAGKLTHGVGDPGSLLYNSLADFCYGDDLVEIRLPWMLLNFFDPPNMQVHDDYYEKYGVEGLSVKQINIGAVRFTDSETVPMSPVNLRGWGLSVRTHERLKQSYYLIKQIWS